MPHPSDARLLVLHGVRLKGFAETSAVAALWELDPCDVESELKVLAEDGLVQRRDGHVSGWSLTPPGREADDAQLVAELDAANARPTVDGAHQCFVEVNPDLLEACTAWQLRVGDEGQRINDHSDAAYDASVVGRLRSVHDRAEALLADLAGSLERFGRYPIRLNHALANVAMGDSEWFTKPLLDSYHTVWFELHEDLLSTLGLRRGDEGRT